MFNEMIFSVVLVALIEVLLCERIEQALTLIDEKGSELVVVFRPEVVENPLDDEDRSGGIEL